MKYHAYFFRKFRKMLKNLSSAPVVIGTLRVKKTQLQPLPFNPFTLYASGRTVLVIAHRLSTIRDADIIAVVAGGKIVEVMTDSLSVCLSVSLSVPVCLSLSLSLSGRTVLVIAHRLSTIRDADIIAVVAGGKIVEVMSESLSPLSL